MAYTTLRIVTTPLIALCLLASYSLQAADVSSRPIHEFSRAGKY